MGQKAQWGMLHRRQRQRRNEEQDARGAGRNVRSRPNPLAPRGLMGARPRQGAATTQRRRGGSARCISCVSGACQGAFAVE